MAQGKRPNNGKAPNPRSNGNRGGQNPGNRNRASGMTGGAPMRARSSENQRPEGMKKGRPENGPAQRPTQARPAGKNAGSKMAPRTPNNPSMQQSKMPSSAPKPVREDRPLFGDETYATAKPSDVVTPEMQAAREKGKNTSWLQRKLQVRKAEKARKKAEKDQAAQKAASEVPEVLEETRPEVGEERQRHMSKARKREALTMSFNAFISILILTVVMVISVLYVVDYVAAKPTYAFATQGTIEHTIGATAIVVRNETVMPSQYSGALLSQATEGSRVAKGQLLAMVIPEGMGEMLADLHNVEQQIVDRERQLMAQGKGSGAKVIFSETNEQIKPIVTMIRQDALQMTLNNMNSYSSSIRVLMEKRDADLNDIDFEDEQLSSLRSSEQALKNQLETRASSIYASEPGIVSYKLDGHEEDIPLTLLLDMVDTKCEELINSCNGVITSDLSVKQNEPVLRIVQNDVQYFACEIKGASISQFGLNSLHTIRIPSEGITISECKVIRSSVTRAGMLIVFETSNQVERLLDRRTVNIEIVQTQESGIKIPVSALVDADYDMGVATIFVNESGYAKGYPVRIKDYDREYAIVAPLEENGTVPSISTIVITNPKTVKEGDKVEK